MQLHISQKSPSQTNKRLDSTERILYNFNSFIDKGCEEKSRGRKILQRVPAGGKGYGRLL